MNAIYLASDASDDLVLRVSAPSAPAEAALELAGFLARAGSAGAAATPAQRSSWPTISPSRAGSGSNRSSAIDRLGSGGGDGADRARSRPCPTAVGLSARLAGIVRVVGLRCTDRRGRRRHRRRGPWPVLVESIERHSGWARFEDRVVCHGDVHPGNVMMTADGPALIDWDLLCWAPAGWDHGPMMTWHERWGGSGGGVRRVRVRLRRVAPRRSVRRGVRRAPPRRRHVDAGQGRPSRPVRSVRSRSSPRVLARRSRRTPLDRPIAAAGRVRGTGGGASA